MTSTIETHLRNEHREENPASPFRFGHSTSCPPCPREGVSRSAGQGGWPDTPSGWRRDAYTITLP